MFPFEYKTARSAGPPLKFAETTAIGVFGAVERKPDGVVDDASGNQDILCDVEFTATIDHCEVPSK